MLFYDVIFSSKNVKNIDGCKTGPNPILPCSKLIILVKKKLNFQMTNCGQNEKIDVSKSFIFRIYNMLYLRAASKSIHRLKHENMFFQGLLRCSTCGYWLNKGREDVVPPRFLLFRHHWCVFIDDIFVWWHVFHNVIRQVLIHPRISQIEPC